MPWKNLTPMEEIIRFVHLARSDRYTLTELCAQLLWLMSLALVEVSSRCPSVGLSANLYLDP